MNAAELAKEIVFPASMLEDDPEITRHVGPTMREMREAALADMTAHGVACGMTPEAAREAALQGFRDVHIGFAGRGVVSFFARGG